MKPLMPLLTLAIGHQNKHITVTAETSSMCACVCVCVCVLQNKMAVVPHSVTHPI